LLRENSEKPLVLIYTNNILAASETFIRNPPQAFTRYRSIFIGSRRIDGLDMSGEQILIANDGKLMGRIRQALYLRLFNDLGVSRLAAQVRQLQPCILQAHYGHAAVHAMELAHTLNLPFIVYYHGLDATIHDDYALQSRYFRPYLQRRTALHQQANLILTQSDFLGKKLLEQGFPPNKIRTHYIGVDTTSTYLPPLEEREAIVLFVARLTEKKGTSFLINAMAQVQQAHPETKLIIVGDGPLREQLEQQAQVMLVNYLFTGWQTPDEVNQWMRKARLFCVPSITAKSGDSEGFGMVFIEAQSWGTPVVSFQHGGIVEAVADGQTGLLAAEGDTSLLAQYIQRLIEDDDLWRTLSQAAYERVKREFDLHKLASKLEMIYDELLQKSS
jgi:colanic acid/amylovoran biosynthesis glycosyltransferase